MITVCLDFEGVLGPEIWRAISKATNIPELMRTTREEPDFKKLMNWRIGILTEHGVTLEQMQAVVAELEPLENAQELLDNLRANYQVIILTDCVFELVEPLIKKMGSPTTFSNSMDFNDAGFASHFDYRVADPKATSVKAIRSAGFKVIATGDSFNDLSMLNAADKGILFRTTDAIAADNQHLTHVSEHKDLLERINQAAADLA